MLINKGQISNFLRSVRLIYWTDWLRFLLQKWRNRRINRAFKEKHPEVQLPPDYLMYESFQLNYEKYYTESQASAQWLVNHLKPYMNLSSARILDWGCGPGRIIRHLPSLLGARGEYYGTDYNAKSIAWCKANLAHIQFSHNGLAANLSYQDNFFDVIYGISIFTHLSKELHWNWIAELQRILRKDGLLFLTTQGDNFKPKLSPQELEQYQKGQLVIRGKVKEGHRTYSTFHPKDFMLHLFKDLEIVAHITPPPEPNKWLPQDIWILRK
ncbi:MAG: class I SAM-dependent methyltransferase [Bacteroidota bacterium]